MSDSETNYAAEEEPQTALKQSVITPLVEFYHDSLNLVRKCNKPDRKEFMRVLTASAIGFAICGATGFVVKLIHIPVNQILVGA